MATPSGRRPVTITTHAPVVLVTSHLWHDWTVVALRHEAAAVTAREALLDAYRQTGQAEGIDRETQAGLVTISAAAFALDALHAEIAPLVGRSADTRAARGRQWGYMLESFRQATSLANGWQGDWEWLGALRGSAVHYIASPSEAVAHPGLPVSVSAQNVDYAVEASSRAVDLLMRAYADLGSQRSEAVVREWVAGKTHVIAQYTPMRIR